MIRVGKNAPRAWRVERSWLLVSVETACYIGILLVAAALRFGNLGLWPLLRGEAAQAWGRATRAWRRAKQASTIARCSFNLTAAQPVRLWRQRRHRPAVAGLVRVACAAVAYFLRDRLGRIRGAGGGAALAISPTLVYFSVRWTGTSGGAERGGPGVALSHYLRRPGGPPVGGPRWRRA